MYKLLYNCKDVNSSFIYTVVGLLFHGRKKKFRTEILTLCAIGLIAHIQYIYNIKFKLFTISQIIRDYKV